MEMKPSSLSWMEIQQIKEEMMADVDPVQKDLQNCIDSLDSKKPTE